MKKYIRSATGDLSLQLFSDAREILDYFEWHNRNLNKRQEEILSDLSDAVDSGSTIAVREAIGNLKFNSKNFTNEQYYIVMDLYNELYTSGGKYESIGRYNDIESSTSIECSTRDPYNVDSKYKLSQRSRNYLSKYIDLTQDVIDDIEQHAEDFDIKADISAYYKDIADFISDWVSIGYSTREAIKLFENNDDEFLELPSGEIIRFVM